MYRAGFEPGDNGKWMKPTNNLPWYLAKNHFHRRDIFQDVYNTSNPRQIALIPNTNHVLTSGISISTVTALIPPNLGVDFSTLLISSQLQVILTWESRCLALALLHAQNPPESYPRTLIANAVIRTLPNGDKMVWDRADTIDLRPDCLCFKSYLQAAIRLGEQLHKADNPLTPTGRQYYGQLIRYTRRRCFFATGDARVGLGPADMRIGDCGYACGLFLLSHGVYVEEGRGREVEAGWGVLCAWADVCAVVGYAGSRGGGGKAVDS